MSKNNATDRGIAFVNDGYYEKAQACFRQARHTAPPFQSAQNLGVYHTLHGMFLTNGENKRANKLGLHYLQKAETLVPDSYENQMALGHNYYLAKAYERSLAHFKRANKIASTPEPNYGKGICLYMLEKFSKAVPPLENYFENTDLSNYSAFAYMYALACSDEHQKAISLVIDIGPKLDGFAVHELFIISFLCENYTLATNYADKLLAEWSLCPEVLAMIFTCYEKVGQSQKVQYALESQVKIQQSFNYPTGHVIHRFHLAYSNKATRQKFINQYHYHPLLPYGSYYVTGTKNRDFL